VARALILAIVVSVLAYARHAGAEDRLRLELDSSPDARACGTADVLRAKIAERLGRDPFTADENAALRLHIAFARSRRVWTAEIALEDAEGRRVGARSLDHEGATCEPLVSSVVFTAVVLLEDLAPRPAEAPPPRAEPQAEPGPAPAPPAVEQRPQPKPAPSLRLDAALGPTGALGGAPAPAFGGEALVGLDVARLRLELSGRAYLPASSKGDVAVRARLVHGRLATCYGWLVASACAVVALGSVSGEAVGAGVVESRAEGRLYAAGGVGAVSRLFFVDDLVFVRASIDVLFALARAGFDVGDHRVWTVPSVGATGVLGLGVRLP
jgi:hypothetical protein